jgi:hypothetical protein
LDEEINQGTTKENLNTNVEEHHEAEVEGGAPPSTIVQGASSTKKINAIKGWTKEI